MDGRFDRDGRRTGGRAGALLGDIWAAMAALDLFEADCTGGGGVAALLDRIGGTGAAR